MHPRWLTGGTFALLLGSATVDAQSVVFELTDGAADRDGYLCWAPVRARARLIPATAAPTLGNLPKRVKLTSRSDPGGGAVWFQEDQGERPNRHTFRRSLSLDVSLASDGAWTSFWLAGARASQGTKDVQVVASREDGTILGALPVMVRVRKDAQQLSSFETQIFLDALFKFHDVDNGSANSEYTDFVRIHKTASHLQIHRSPLFLPWHRALVLDLERRLQAIDARVTVPYWRFDRAAERVFSADFMGVTDPGVPFSPGARLGRWIDPMLGGLNRDPSAAPADGLLDGTIPALFNTSYVIFRGQLESQFHNGVHTRVGGWLAKAVSPADPLFFLLHANVDRVWAHWQTQHDRFDSENEETYSSQGRYPGVGPDAGLYMRGVYAEDEMWPWGYTGQTGPVDTGWPAINHSMPLGNQASVTLSVVTPGSQIDYQDVNGKGRGLGYCYDDIDFVGQLPW